MISLVADPKQWKFVIRVYAIILNDDKDVLLSDECFMDTQMTKFPGGGLEFGEGTIDCLKREAIEEFGQEIEIVRHFYTTDFFQSSLFHDNTQLISIYYIAQFKGAIKFKISTYPFDFPFKQNGSQAFRWVKIENLTADDLTFPIDKHIVQLLKDI